MPPISLLIKPSSGMCNLRCSYCFYYDLTSKREISSYGFMTEETLECVVKRALEFAEDECHIAFQGGEPTLSGLHFFEKVIEFEKKYSKEGLVIYNSIQTNGYKLDEAWCKFFVKHSFLVGLSIDGVKDTHDTFRKTPEGEGTYVRILETMKLFNQFGVEYNILTVINKKTAPKIRKIYANYEKKGFHYQQYIPCLDPIGEKRGAQEYSLTPQEYGTFLIELFELWYQDLQIGKQPYIRQFDNYIGILLGYQPESCEQRGVCSLQNVVEADGSVYPCDFFVLDQYGLGNLNEESFSEMYEKQENYRFIKESRDKGGICSKCKYYAICKGGCRRQWTGFTENGLGNSEEAHNYFCESYYNFFEVCLERLEGIVKRVKFD